MNPQGILPQTETVVNGNVLTLPEFYDHVYALNQVIEVDYFLPGCPPPTELILNAIHSVLSGDLPPKGSALAPRKALCDTCSRNETKPEKLTIHEFKRVATSTPDPKECFLTQGYICLGPATRSGCGERCINGNMPCRGCFGPPDGVADQGAKMLSAIASIIDAASDPEIDRAVDAIVDPLGTFYRFSLPSSLLGRKKIGG